MCQTRALVNEPEVLLLDEPLGALDLKMRKDMQIELMNMHRQLGITFIYVTHDQEEALTMSDTIVVMKDGVIQQIANPQKIYDEPANAFVADFIGESNILSGTFIKDCLVDVLGHQLACVDKGFKKKEPVDVIIRPEDIELLPEDDEKAYLFAKVTSCVFKGDHFQTTVETDDEEKKRAFNTQQLCKRRKSARGRIRQALRPAHNAQKPHHQRACHRYVGQQRG